MANRNQGTYNLIGALGMIVLLSMLAFAPTMAGFFQQQYRSQRQNTLRQDRFKATAIQINLSKIAVSGCYFPKDHELVIDGLRYDVVSVQQQGSQVIFNAVPDLKETHLCAWMSGNFPDFSVIGKQSIRFTLSDYLPNPNYWHISPPTNAIRRSPFMDVEVRLLAGFERMFSPPPDWHKRLS